jgi:hypothetical protein
LAGFPRQFGVPNDAGISRWNGSKEKFFLENFQKAVVGDNLAATIATLLKMPPSDGGREHYKTEIETERKTLKERKRERENDIDRDREEDIERDK